MLSFISIFSLNKFVIIIMGMITEQPVVVIQKRYGDETFWEGLSHNYYCWVDSVTDITT